MDAQRKYWTTTSGPPILWRSASRKRGRQDELSSDECSSPPRNYCTINQEMVKRGGFSFAPDRNRSTSISANQDSYLLTPPMGTEVQLDQEGCHSDTSSTFTSGSDTSEAREQCAYCGRMTRQWILASGGRLCILPTPECCRDNYAVSCSLTSHSTDPGILSPAFCAKYYLRWVTDAGPALEIS